MQLCCCPFLGPSHPTTNTSSMSAFSFINNTASANNTAPAVTAGVSLGGLPPLPPLSPVPYAVSAGTFSAAGFGWLDTSAMPNMEQAQRAAERRRQEVREQQENFIAAMRFPLPRPSPTVSYDHPLTPTFHAPTERLLRCRAVITTVLRYTGLPSAQRLPTDLVSLIASFVHQPGCLGRVRHSLATSAALDVTERQIDDRLCLTASHYDDAGQYSEAQEGCVVAGTTYHVSSTAPPFAGSMSRSVQRGHVYLQWVNSVLVLDERCRLLRRLQLEPPADLPPPPSENGLFFLDEEQKRAWRLKARLQVMYLRVVRMSDGVERLLTLDEESLLHFWSLDGAYHHTLGQGRVTVQRGPLGRVLAVAVSPRDDSLYISQECDGGLRMHHRVDRRDREGREAGQFAELDGRAGGVHTLHLLPSPYEPRECDWLYALGYGAVTVFDATSCSKLFCVGQVYNGRYVPPITALHSPSQHFIQQTLAHRIRHPSLPPIGEPHPPSEGRTTDRIDMTQVCITDFACDDQRGELYLFEATSSRWYVCDARGHLLRYWQERRPVDAPVSLERSRYHREASEYDPVRHRLLSCERLQTCSTVQGGPANRTLQAVGTFLTIAV